MSDEDKTRMDPSKWDSVDTDWYDKRWQQMAASGQNPHGEADFVSRFSPSSVLDAGCGTGRVAIELAARGCAVAGVDLDGPMIAKAQDKAPDLDFRQGDLSTVELGRTFDVVVMAGNVMIFVAPGTEANVIDQMSTHVSPGGRLIAGFQLGRGLDVVSYNDAASEAGLTLERHCRNWDGELAAEADDYAVLVHLKAQAEGD